MDNKNHHGSNLVHLDLEEITTPAFLVDLDVARQNAINMRQRCEKMNVNLRPHMKTHKTRFFGEIMTGGTKRSVVVSTLAEAEYFADGGFDDILYAFPFTKDKLNRLKALAGRLSAFHVLLDSDYALDCLLEAPLGGDKKWSVYLKVECGYLRAGVPWDSQAGLALARRLHKEETIAFQGIYAHDGTSYNAKGEAEIQDIGGSTADKLLSFTSRLEKENIPCQVVATGSTPTCSKPDVRMANLTEFHPGNYIFYDFQQHLIGSCGLDEIAGVVATRVIGQYPHRKQLLIDCGWLGLSLDGNRGAPGGSYCLIKGEPNLKLTSMKQEAGIVEAVEGEIEFDRFPIGTVLYLVPYHACATASMHPVYYVHTGGKVVDKCRPCRGW